MKISVLLILFIIFISCTNKKSERPLAINNTHQLDSVNVLLENQVIDWYFKDVTFDTIPGISLERAVNEKLLTNNNEEVIIAILDNTIDISHQSIAPYLWLNKNEIRNNNIDDDENGYIDDINGWNFLGNSEGEISLFQTRGHIRIINELQDKFIGKSNDEILNKDIILYNEYLRAKLGYTKDSLSAISQKNYAKYIRDIFNETKAGIIQYFPNGNFNTKDLDSLKLHHTKDTTLQRQILVHKNFILYGNDEAYISKLEWETENTIKYVLDLKFDERKIQNDNDNDLNDTKYGNGVLNWELDKLFHGTKVASLAPLNITKLINPNIKIMPIVVSSFGENHSKDLALAIYYAVDNGAKVINMSFTKEFTLNNEWLKNALIFANMKNVLIVKAAGNENQDTDNSDFYDFPNDKNTFEDEYVSNFIVVGASTVYMDKRLRSFYSNYGKINVDVFAPGDEIYTAIPGNNYKFDGGTSLASAITSGVAALLFSYYPSLTASQVKQIIMDSGVEYDIPVSVPTEENPEQLIPFNQISKSGKIVNAYNALIMAEQLVKKNKK